jgi:hypothetical protein
MLEVGTDLLENKRMCDAEQLEIISKAIEKLKIEQCKVRVKVEEYRVKAAEFQLKMAMRNSRPLL